VLELNALRHRRGDAPVVRYQALCRELSRAGPGCAGELCTTGARSILRRYSDAWFCAAGRRREGDLGAHLPRRRKALMPSRYYAGTFCLEGRRLTVPTARGAPSLDLRLTRDIPYHEGSVRSVTLVNIGPRLFVDVTAEVPVASHGEATGPDPERVAGVDLGIIHPFALASESGALVVSGRAIRAENRPRGLLKNDAERRQNLAVANWRPGQAIAAFSDEAELAGIAVELVDERGTSSTCPRCKAKVAKPNDGGSFVLPVDWLLTEMWWELPTSPREGLGVENPLTQLG
jgi:hypothetical protein